MSGHTFPSDGSAPFNDVVMDDLTAIADALPGERAPHEAKDEAHDDAATNLRLELIRNMFTGQVVELKNLAEPVQCLEYPNHKGDVIAAYLACGKLQLPSKKHNEFANIDPAVLKFQHVNFKISTPFRNIADMNFDIVHGESGPHLAVSGKFRAEFAGIHRLNKYMNSCLKHVRRVGLTYGTDGIVLQELEKIATMFRRDREQMPGRQDDWEQPVYGGGEWAGVEEPTYDRGRW